MKYKTLSAKYMTNGKGKGKALVSKESICFWGGVDPKTGIIVDKNHSLFGETITDKVLVFPRGHGSSSSSAVILETILQGSGPSAIINITCEPIITVGFTVAEVIYDINIPVVVVSGEDFNQIKTGDYVEIDSSENNIKLYKD